MSISLSLSLSLYIYIYINYTFTYIERERERETHTHTYTCITISTSPCKPHSRDGLAREMAAAGMAGLGNFTSLDFDICLRSFCADSSSPQISAILFDHFA